MNAMDATTAFDIFMHTTNYANMLFVTFPMLRVNRYYRKLVDERELTGVSYGQSCAKCSRKQTICIYALKSKRFECLVCRLDIPRPWYDEDARQWVGYQNEVRPDFLLDLRAWGWAYAVGKFHDVHQHAIDQYAYASRQFAPLREIGAYIANPRTWKTKWMLLLLTPTRVPQAADMRYIVWRWYRIHAGMNHEVYYQPCSFGTYLLDEMDAWFAQPGEDTAGVIHPVEWEDSETDREYTDDEIILPFSDDDIAID